MIIELLLLIATIYAVFIIISDPKPPKWILDALNDLGDDVCNQLQIQIPDYHLHHTTSNSHTIFRKRGVPQILLRMVDAQGRLFDTDTIYMAFLHELAHVILPHENHSDKFDKLEDILIDAARDLKYLSRNARVADDYPCKHT
jgi:predicted metal-dependent hydrolase